MKKRKQKFNYGDLVQITDDLGQSMDHFDKGCRAIVIGSYKDQYGGSNITDYTVHVEGKGQVSWYHESQLIFIRYAPSLLIKWKEKAEKAEENYKDIKWIKRNWKTNKVTYSSILRLFDLVDYHSDFHDCGEYFVLHQEWLAMRPFLNILMTARTEKSYLAAMTKEFPDIKNHNETAIYFWNKLQQELKQ